MERLASYLLLALRCYNGEWIFHFSYIERNLPANERRAANNHVDLPVLSRDPHPARAVT